MVTSLHDDIYQVRLPVFEGPLDLLLQLIEREKLDISTVSLAAVADQFLAYVRQIEEVSAETLADFLTIAARLVWIKSRLLLPRPAGRDEEEEEEDPAEALARQLREYKRFKEAAAALRAIEEAGYHTYLRDAPLPELERHLEPQSSALIELLTAAQTALANLAESSHPENMNGMVTPFTLTIHDQIALIRRSTAAGRSVTFRSLLAHAQRRIEIIVTLLAVLELIKRKQITVEQRGLFGEIILAPVPDAPGNGDETEEE